MRTTIREAVIGDISKIHELINLYSREELLLPKSKAELTVMLPSFFTAEYCGQFAGSVAFKIGEDEKAEIVSWVVDKRYFNHGIGSMLITAVMEKIEDLDIKVVYTLTLRPNTFEKHGYRRVGMEELPKKVWTDCIHCPRNIAVPGSVDCKEIAMLKTL